jgi:hypothetical protein
MAYCKEGLSRVSSQEKEQRGCSKPAGETAVDEEFPYRIFHDMFI